MTQALFQSGSIEEAAAWKLWAGNRALSLGDLCRLEYENDGLHQIRLEGDFSGWNAIGFGLAQGHIEINGHAGARTGGELAGGVIEIHGDCGPWAAVAARTGRMKIHGDAGDWLASHWPGETCGLTGAEIVVQGNAGDHAGARMRRGLLAIGGNVGVGLGRGMVAGSIFVAGAVAGPVGSGMKRGSIVLNRADQQISQCLLPSFQQAGLFRPLTLDMQLQYLAGLGWQNSAGMIATRDAERFYGDMLATGLGEVLLLQ